jgi:hypothetical protein
VPNFVPHPTSKSIALGGTSAVTDKRVYIGTVGVLDYFIPHHCGFFAVDRANRHGNLATSFQRGRPNGHLRSGFVTRRGARNGVFRGSGQRVLRVPARIVALATGEYTEARERLSVIAASHILPWPVSGWGCPGRRLSRA